MKNRILAVALCLLMIISFSACREGSPGGSSLFALNLSGNPENLDPQLSTDSASAEIIKNTFRTLMKKDSVGKVIPDAAEGFVLSEDGLTYTFSLKGNIFWQSANGFSAPLTADDFVFAFYRMFNPKTESPYRDTFLCIKNAARIIEGDTYYKSIGVSAIDDKTLEITLDYPCWNFLELLSENASAPCSEAFFELTKGRYGLDPDNDASSGAFFVTEHNFDPYWNENYIILSRNEKNSETDPVLPKTVTYYIKPPEENETDYKANDIDFLLSDEYSSVMKSAGAEGFLTKAVIIRTSDELVLSYPELAAALSYSAFSYEPPEKSVPAHFVRAKGIIPPAVTMMGRVYRDSAGDNDFRPEEKGSVGDEYYGDLRLTVRADAPYSDLCFELSDYWRDVLGVNIFVEAVSDTEYESIKNSGFDLLVDEISSDKNSPESFLRFGGAMDDEIFRIKSASSISYAIEFTKESEIAAIHGSHIIPFLFGSEYFAHKSDISGAVYLPFERFIIMKDAVRK